MASGLCPALQTFRKLPAALLSGLRPLLLPTTVPVAWAVPCTLQRHRDTKQPCLKSHSFLEEEPGATL